MSTTMILYDLADALGQPISPYAWRVREALLFLGIPFDSCLLPLREIPQHLPGDYRTVPVLIDNEQIISDSWHIVRHLAKFHDADKQLFGNAQECRFTRFIIRWIDASIMAAANSMLIKDVHDVLALRDRAYFRSGQEKKTGQTLESLHAARESVRPAFQLSLHPARMHLKENAFLGGRRANYADFVLHSVFVWCRAVSRFELLRADDSLHTWIKHMDELLDSHWT